MIDSYSKRINVIDVDIDIRSGMEEGWPLYRKTNATIDCGVVV